MDLLIGSAMGLFTSFLWAISTNVYKSQSNEATPLAISSVKMWAAMIAMTALVLLPFRTTPFYMPLDSLLFLVSSVTVGLVIGDLLYLTSQERIGVSYAFPITSTYPIVTYLIAMVFVEEPILVSRLLGVIVAVLGITIISRSQAMVQDLTGTDHDPENPDTSDPPSTPRRVTDWFGIALALMAALCWATGSVLLQIGVHDVDPIDANFVRMVFGSGIFIPVFSAAVTRGMPLPSKRATGIVMAAGLLGMTLGSLLYTFTVKLIGASVASLMGSMSPLFALPISTLVLKEAYSARSIVGALMTVTGVILVIIAV
ncbi:MAG: DMT family transporter [Candidatus Thorarchaeota archaeon]